MPSESSKKKQEEVLDFRSEYWYNRAKERFSIVSANLRREFILSFKTRLRRINSDG
jgi:hypothetical protein